MNIAELGIKIDTGDAAAASTELDKMAEAGARAEQSTLGVTGQANKAGAALKDTGTGAKAAQAELAKFTAQTEKYTVSAKQQAAAMRGVPAQFTDIVTSIQGGQAPLTVLLQQGGQLKDMFGGVGPAAKALGTYVSGLINPFTAAAAAAAALGLVYYKGSEEADGYRKALILSGDAAGVTAGNLASMARQISATIGTTGAAAGVLTLLAGSGNIAAGSFEGITKAALTMQQATGTAVEDTVAQFAALAKDPVDASAKLNEQYHYLTASVYEQITALEKQGDKAAAVKLATDTFADAIETRGAKITERLGYIEGAWNKVAKAAKWAWDSSLDLGREATYEQKMADLETQAENARRLGTGSRGGGGRSLADIEAQKTSLMLAEQERRNRAQATKAAQDRDSAAVLGVQLINREAESAGSTVDKLNKKLDDLDKARQKNIQNKSYTPELQKQYETAVAGYQKQLDDAKKKAAGPAGSVDLTAFNNAKNAMSLLVGDYQDKEKQLEAAQKNGLISQSQYFAQRAALINDEKTKVGAAYDAEISALETAKNKATTTGAQRIQLDQKIADARADQTKALKGFDSEQAVLATNEKGRLDQAKVASQAYVEQLERQRAALGIQGDRAAASIGQSDRQQGLQSDLNAAADKFSDERAKLLDRRKTAPDKYSQEDYEKDLASLNNAEGKYSATVVANYDKMTAAQGNWESGAESAFHNYVENAQNIAGQTKEAFASLYSGMTDAAVDWAFGADESFGDVAVSFAKMLVKMELQAAASSVFSGAASSGLGALLSGLIGGGASSAGSTAAGYSSSYLSGWSLGGRATGGDVAPSSLYQVNELGPELYNEGGKSYLMTGANGGSVTPLGTSSMMGSSGGSTMGSAQVNITINRDGSASVDSDTALGKDIGSGVLTMIDARIKMHESKSLGPQGSIRRAINGRG
jgi:lambda family phage tail tape measure protein